jgi:hypothetical protein
MKTNQHNPDGTITLSITPTPGRAIIRLDPMYCQQEGLIIIPETLQGRKALSGTVLEINPDTFRRKCRNCCWLQAQGRSCIKCGGRTKPIQPVYDGFSESLTGKRVSVEGMTVTQISADTCIVAISDITATLPASDAVKLSTGQIPRCQRCGSAKAGTTQATLMVNSPRGYYCPRCGRYENGDKYVDPVLQAQKEAGRI